MKARFKHAVGLLAAMAVVLPVGGATLAAYTGDTPSSGNRIEAGSVDLRDNDSGSALLSLYAIWFIVVTLVPTTSPPHRIAVGRLDPRTGEVFLLGTIDPVVNSFWCRLAGSRLICSTPDGRLVITDVG